jgi:MarR-like DNA-binding transcriptional regulator SgrR of sgrS sRNA
MSLRELIIQDQEETAQKAISEKIFTLMQNIRNGASDDGYQRRWVWELLQNAVDTTNNEYPIKIEIVIDDINKNLHFKHNGKPFKLNNLTHLIKQLSTKPRVNNSNESIKTIGKFGTGSICSKRN